MHNKALLLIISLFCCNTVLSVLSSCGKKNYTIKTTRCDLVSCFEYGSASVKAVNSATHAPLQAPAYSVKATDLTLQIVLEGNTHICYKKAPSKKWYERMSLISTAEAIMAPEACLIRQGGDSIVSYNIFSDKDYDQTHPAGTSLKDMVSTDDIPSNALMGHYDSYNAMVMNIMFDKAPEQSGNGHKFTIILTQKDGDTISVTTEAINLLL